MRIEAGRGRGVIGEDLVYTAVQNLRLADFLNPDTGKRYAKN
jgi:hypothetical protein